MRCNTLQTYTSSFLSLSLSQHQPLPSFLPSSLTIKTKSKEMEESLISNAYVRVLVVKFGNVKASSFTTYFKRLCSFSTIPLALVTKPAGITSSNTAFDFLDWQSGVIRYNFVVQQQKEQEQKVSLSKEEDDKFIINFPFLFCFKLGQCV